jgi:tetratricopeptide (TPR) repeat protein
VTLSASKPVADLDDPALLAGLTVAYTGRPAPAAYYDDCELEGILEGYARGREEATILFPCTAIRCLRRLAELGGGGLLVLTADYGNTGAEGERRGRGLALHGGGCFSLPVNYHAIAEWVLVRGGQVLKTAHRHTHLAVAAFLLGEGPYAETRLAYDLVVERAGPDDFFTLGRGLQAAPMKLGLAQLLSLLRLSHWDPRVLQDLLTALWSHVEAAPEDMQAEVVHAVVRAWDNHYPMGETFDLAFELGLLAHAHGGHREALELFAASVRLHGDDPRARWKMALCHWAEGEAEAALRCFADAARLDPTFRPVRAVQVKG